MKKLFAILAAALLVVACGGGNTKEEPKSIEDQALEHVAKIEKATKNGDYEELQAAQVAFEEWFKSLNDEQQNEAALALVEWMESNNYGYGYDEDYEDYEW